MKNVADNGSKASSSRSGGRPGERVCLLVLGMHRSGTSMVTRVLSLLGAALPAHLMPPVPDNNIAGFWESQPLSDLHDRMLEEAGSGWNDWRSFDPEALGSERSDHYKHEIQRLISEEFERAPLFVLKDPRICRFVPFYRELLTDLGVETRSVLCYRNPLSVTASLKRRDGTSEGYGGLVWLRHVLEAERATRGHMRTVVAYERLLENWRDGVAQMGSDLNLEWPVDIATAGEDIEACIDPALQHHSADRSDLRHDAAIPEWLREVYESLLALEQGRRPPEEVLDTLDRVREEFDSSAPIFAAAMFPELQSRQQELGSLQEAHADLEERLRESVEAVLELQTVRQNLETVRGELESNRQQLEADLEAIRSDRLREFERAEELVKERADLVRQVTGFSKEITALSSRVDVLEAAREALRDRLAAMEGVRSGLEQEVGDLVRENQTLSDSVRSLVSETRSQTARLAELGEESEQLRRALETRQGESARREKELSALRFQLEYMSNSRSWRWTAPPRAVLRRIKAGAAALGRTLLRSMQALWRGVPLSAVRKRRLKSRVFTHMPTLFARTHAYRAWKEASDGSERLSALTAGQAGTSYVPPNVKRVDSPASRPPENRSARVICFYLPQFHQIPENDEWWGEGFTEWTNVTAAVPQFAGHQQPNEPGELGYYDLRDVQVQQRQVELARLHGIEAFCFYLYWFGGQRLLDAPIENYLKDPSLDFPFCLCWANENWSRRWDGRNDEILIAQKHSPADDLAFIEYVARYLADPRYLRIDDRPLLVVYRPGLLPSAKETARRWRDWCRENGIGEIFLAYTQSFERLDPAEYGFDAAIEFPPNNTDAVQMTEAVEPLTKEFDCTIYDWRSVALRSADYPEPTYPLFRGVCPGWDNTPRRGARGTVFLHNTPDRYREWLANAVRDTERRFEQADERLVFVNAWNEWAEGAYLEPDARAGYAYLQATRDAVSLDVPSKRKRVVVVSHDAYQHGAQLIALNLTRELSSSFGFDVDLILLGEGPLIEAFEEVATVHRVDLVRDNDGDIRQRLQSIRDGGASIAFVNTTVSGVLVPLLKKLGFATVCLVHEMPGLIEEYGLQEQAEAIAGQADHIVFPSAPVKEGFESVVGRALERATIRPQGLYLRVPWQSEDERTSARSQVRADLGLSAQARIVLSVGYADRRKGLDLFVDVCARLMREDPRAVAIWAGNVEGDIHRRQLERIRAAGLEERFVFPGFIDDPDNLFIAADVFALTSREDPFPSVALEALASRTPVVAWRGATGCDSLLERGCGELVEPYDIEAFSQALGSLLADRRRHERLGGVGEEIVRRELDFHHYPYDLLELAGVRRARVSVVVPNYNYAAYLQQRLESVVHQTHPIFELIVLDDASSDGSVDLLRRLLNEIPVPSFLSVNASNSGSVSQQWRRGVEMARGEFVWIAEADDAALPELVEELLGAFRDPDVVMSYCQSRQIDGDGHLLSEHYLDYVADIDRDRWTKPYVANGRREIAEALYVKNTIPNVSGVLFRREALLRVLTDHAAEIESYRDTGDWVTYIRLLEEGSIAFSPRPLNIHRRHGASVTIGDFGLRHLQEIVRVQSQTIRRLRLGAEAQSRAAAYAQRLFEQFGLADEAHPHFSDHPELHVAAE